MPRGATPSPAGAAPTHALTPSSTPTAHALSPSGTAAAGSGAAGWVALTVDAGADRGYAADIRDILEQEHVLASFGITGLWARANPDLVRRIAADGHLVFNHTY